jgi:hypothetical protein
MDAIALYVAGRKNLRCVPISGEALSVSRVKALMQWRFEHLSLRADNAQPMSLNLRG